VCRELYDNTLFKIKNPRRFWVLLPPGKSTSPPHRGITINASRVAAKLKQEPKQKKPVINLLNYQRK
jgi:hypothetical protein